MAFEDSGLFREVQRLFNESDGADNFYRYELTVVYKDGRYTAEQVVGISIVEDYLKEYGVMMVVRFKIPAGFYQNYVIRNQDTLSAILKAIPLVNDDLQPDYERAVEVGQYEMVLRDTLFGQLPGVTADNIDFGNSDLSQLVNVDAELLDPAIQLMESRMVGGVFSNMVPGDVIKYVMTSEGLKDKTGDANEFKGVHMHPAMNTEVRRHVVIPEAMSLLTVPEYIQEKEGGVYYQGINLFIKRGIAYINPIYYYDRVAYENKTLTIVDIPSTKRPGVEQTYRVDGDELFILSNGATLSQDETLPALMTEGNGVFFTKASDIVGSFTEYKQGDAVIEPGRHQERGVVYPLEGKRGSWVQAKGRIVSNEFNAYSQVAKNQGLIAKFKWGNSRPDLIRPCMACRVMVEVEGDVKTIQGVVAGISTQVVLNGNFVQGRHESTSVIYVLLKREELR